jgi:hypothetical protein
MKAPGNGNALATIDPAASSSKRLAGWQFVEQPADLGCPDFGGLWISRTAIKFYRYAPGRDPS